MQPGKIVTGPIKTQMSFEFVRKMKFEKNV